MGGEVVPGRAWLLARPAVVLALAFAVTFTAAWLMGAAYDALNQEASQAGPARGLLAGSLFAALMGLLVAGILMGRGFAWLLLPGLAGLLFLGDILETAWARWGMDWDGGEMLLPPVVVGFILFAIGLAGLSKTLGPQRASKAVAFPMAFFLGPIAIFGWSLLARFQEVADNAEQSWTSEHGDPSLGAVAVAAALVGSAIAWRRGRRP